MPLNFNSTFLLKTSWKYQVSNVIKTADLGAQKQNTSTNPLGSMDQQCSIALKKTYQLITFLGVPVHLSPNLTGSRRYLDWSFDLPGAETAVTRLGNKWQRVRFNPVSAPAQAT